MLIDKAMKMMLDAHFGQLDKAGKPYSQHPIRVMMQMETEEEKLTALLHDVLEDSHFTREDMVQQGFPEIVIQAVELLTKPDDVEYLDYIERIKRSGIVGRYLAVKVKVFDLEDNMNILRLRALRKQDIDRLKKYHEAWRMLAREL